MGKMRRFIKRWLPAREEISKSKQAIAMIRREYEGNPLQKNSVAPNPFDQFSGWFDEAVKKVGIDPNAMTLSTVSDDDQPSSRTVLLKGFDENGFVFYTNYLSRKGHHIEKNPKVSLTFYWTELIRQVQIEGVAQKISESQSDAYFKTRPTASKLSAWASNQSNPLGSREELDQRFKEFEEKFDGGEIPRPPNWGGYLVIPHRMEFWQGRINRLHDRICYTLKDGEWIIERLAP